MLKRRQYLDRERISLSPYDPQWAVKFEQERLRLLEQPYLEPAHIAHIGSTAVDGMCAKPTIDILVGMNNPGSLASALASLQVAGYEYLPEYEVDTPDRMFCIRRGVDGSRDFHVSLTVNDGRFWRSHLMFRNRLREDRALCERYASLKETLAERFEFDRARYVAGKSGFIADELRRVLPAVEQFAEASWRGDLPCAGDMRTAALRTAGARRDAQKVGVQ